MQHLDGDGRAGHARRPLVVGAGRDRAREARRRGRVLDVLEREVVLGEEVRVEDGAVHLGDGANPERLLAELGEDLGEREPERALDDALGVAERVAAALRVQPAEEGAQLVGEQVGARAGPLRELRARRAQSQRGLERRQERKREDAP